MLNYIQQAKLIAQAMDRDPIMAMTIKQHLPEKRILDCLDLPVITKYENEIIRLSAELRIANKRTVLQHIKHLFSRPKKV